MKKFLLTVCVAALTLGASAFNFTKMNESNLVPTKMQNIKEAPAALAKKYVKDMSLKAKPAKAITQQSDLYKGYTMMGLEVTSGSALDTTFSTGNEVTAPVLITAGNNDSIVVTGLGAYLGNTFKGTFEYDSTYDLYYISLDYDQVVYTSSTYGDCGLRAIFYYQGDNTYEAGWYYTTPEGYIDGDDIIFAGQYLCMTILSGTYQGYTLGYYYYFELYQDGTVGRMDVIDLQSDNFVDLTTPTEFHPVTLSQTGDVVTVGNFGGWFEPVDVTLAADQSLTIASQLVASATDLGNSAYGDFYTRAADFTIQADSLKDYLLADPVIYGTATTTQLNLTTSFMYYSTTKYWTGEAIYAATIYNFGDPFTFPSSVEYKKGDVNGDGLVDVSDINILIAIMLGADDAANYDGRANVDGSADGAVDVSDINAVIEAMLN